jgi:hypothetical protein
MGTALLSGLATIVLNVRNVDKDTQNTQGSTPKQSTSTIGILKTQVLVGLSKGKKWHS